MSGALSTAKKKVSDCSPANRERELGLDRREIATVSKLVREEHFVQIFGK